MLLYQLLFVKSCSMAFSLFTFFCPISVSATLSVSLSVYLSVSLCVSAETDRVPVSVGLTILLMIRRKFCLQLCHSLYPVDCSCCPCHFLVANDGPSVSARQDKHSEYAAYRSRLLLDDHLQSCFPCRSLDQCLNRSFSGFLRRLLIDV